MKERKKERKSLYNIVLFIFSLLILSNALTVYILLDHSPPAATVHARLSKLGTHYYYIKIKGSVCIR
ncbi:hypothetical protein CFP56_016484 [Quercus suber]|uniref:Uncharacterized protein n=1 Tax=Quercus suber TaxID=58331 RepID=A0AAW0M471_QUESU